MTGSAGWMDESPETTYADAEAAFEDLDVEPTALQHSRTESEIAGMARLAREGGERDRKRILQMAYAEGKALGARAYYSFPMGGKDIFGPTIQLANALVNVWGDIAIQISDKELVGHELRLTVRVMDLRSGVMQERPHFYTLTAPSGNFAKNTENKSRWMAMQAQSAVSKAIRTTVFNLLPDWVTQTALRAARDASKVKVTDGKIQAAVNWWAEQGVTLEQLVGLVGESPDRWTSEELTKVRDLGKAMKDGEITLEEIFGDSRPRPAAAQASQPTGSDALGGKKPGPAPEPEEPKVDPEAEALKARITDILTELGPHAVKALQLQGIDARVPVDAWEMPSAALQQLLTFLENWKRVTTADAPAPRPIEKWSRDELKAGIQEHVERIGIDMACDVLQLDRTKWEPVSTWRAHDKTLIQLYVKLRQVVIEEPDAPALVDLQKRLAELFDEASGPDSVRDSACWSALEEAGVPSKPWMELTEAECTTAIEALNALRQRLQQA